MKTSVRLLHATLVYLHVRKMNPEENASKKMMCEEVVEEDGVEATKTWDMCDEEWEAALRDARYPYEEKEGEDVPMFEQPQLVRRTHANQTWRRKEVRPPSYAGAVTRTNNTPLPAFWIGNRVQRPNTVVLHTQAFEAINSREVIEALSKHTTQANLKCVQQVPGPRYRVTFRTSEAKEKFLNEEFYMREERVVAQELHQQHLVVRVLFVPDEISNEAVAEAFTKFGKVHNISREMYRDFPEVETGVRIVTLGDLRQGIPRKLRLGDFPVETRYRGQIPQCHRCGDFGHRAATCVNPVRCFKCGKDGHVRKDCYKCFYCGEMGHIKQRCPEYLATQEVAGQENPAEQQDPEGETSMPVDEPQMEDPGQQQPGGEAPMLVVGTPRADPGEQQPPGGEATMPAGKTTMEDLPPTTQNEPATTSTAIVPNEVQRQPDTETESSDVVDPETEDPLKRKDPTRSIEEKGFVKVVRKRSNKARSRVQDIYDRIRAQEEPPK